MGQCSRAIQDKTPDPLFQLPTESTLDSSPSKIPSVSIQLQDGSLHLMEPPPVQSLADLKCLIYQHFSSLLLPEQMVILANGEALLPDSNLTMWFRKPSPKTIALVQLKAELYETEGVKYNGEVSDHKTGEKGVAQMSCGHCIGRQHLRQLIKHQGQQKASSITCPFKELNEKACHRVWSVEQVRLVAGLTEPEMEILLTQLLKNQTEKTSSLCSFCSQFVSERSQARKQCCPTCRSSFCRKCLNFWKGPQLDICKYDECNFIRQLLQTAPKTAKFNLELPGKKGRQSVVVPNVRACPRCGLLLSSINKDKRVKCPCVNMEFSFCCICLSLVNEQGKSSCGPSHQHCGPETSN